MEGADVGMVQARDGSGFALEALALIWIDRKVLGKNFDGNGTVEAGVIGFVDLAHPAGAKGREDFVRAKTCA
jgi:hypothetical protein